ncbi:BatD family protein [Persicobacter psychrovividus]
MAQFATVHISKKEVVVKQGIQVKVTAYSPTWFAEPLTFANLQVEGAFIQSFSKTVPGIKKIKGKQYSTLEFYYILFPYREGELTFPELTIKTKIPKEGEYKGTPTTLKTKPLKIKVKPNPGQTGQWIVANHLTISDHWSKDLSNLKVGDVVDRTITLRAYGTLPSFIDEAPVAKVDFANIYPHAPKFFDQRTDRQVNGKRVDKYSYLLEKDGEFTIPPVEVKWWNPSTNKFYHKKLSQRKLTVNKNEDLASLQYLKDSLNSYNIHDSEVPQVKESLIEDRVLKIALIALLLMLLWYITFTVFKLNKYIKGRMEAYSRWRKQHLLSEKYAFKQLMKSKNEKDFISSFYHWLLQISMTGEPTTSRKITEGNTSLTVELDALQQHLYSSKKNRHYNLNTIKKYLFNWRKKAKDTSKTKNDEGRPLKDLNP